MKTPSEVAFCSILEAWQTLFEDGMHIDAEFRPYFQRELQRMTRDDIKYTADLMVVLIADLTDVIEAAGRGGLRDEWIPLLKPIADDFVSVVEIVYNELMVRLN